MAKPIQLLAKSSKLLHSLADRGPLPISELAEELDMPRPSVYRLTDALRLVGLVLDTEDGRSQLGLEVLHLARAVLDALPEVQAARDELRRLNRVTGQTVYLCAPRESGVACLDWVRGTRVSLLALSLAASSRSMPEQRAGPSLRTLPACLNGFPGYGSKSLRPRR
ncbi:transcriptional regulator protein [Arthrobacter sp. Hiyo6]|nr:transcriptional regulator protein [Arthrobacter sp. Hiyo6]